MKIAASFLLFATQASSFSLPFQVKYGRTVSILRESLNEATESDAPVAMEVSEEVETPAVVTESTPLEPEMSMSMPFMVRPAALDGTMAGDVGFDPFGFAKTQEDLMNYREAEVKHGRLAMLAAAGWPLSELFDRKIANVLGMSPLVDATDRAPSLLNGGLGKISPLYWVGCVAVAAAVDAFGIYKRSQGSEEYFPGNLGFDPLGLYPETEDGKARMQLSEIKHGRLAMIAITAFAFQEFVSKSGVIDETPLFFKPFNQVVFEYANSGYVYH